MSDAAPRYPSQPSYTSQGLAAALGVRVRTLRRWISAGLFSPSEFRGRATRYGARHVDEARVILRLRADNLTLDAIKRRMAALSEAEFARLARPEKGSSRQGRGAEAPSDEPKSGAELRTEAREPGLAAAPYPAERWEHVVLLPGLELRVKSDAGPLLRRVAQEIYERYAADAEVKSAPSGP